MSSHSKITFCVTVMVLWIPLIALLISLSKLNCSLFSLFRYESYFLLLTLLIFLKNIALLFCLFVFPDNKNIFMYIHALDLG